MSIFEEYGAFKCAERDTANNTPIRMAMYEECLQKPTKAELLLLVVVYLVETLTHLLSFSQMHSFILEQWKPILAYTYKQILIRMTTESNENIHIHKIRVSRCLNQTGQFRPIRPDQWPYPGMGKMVTKKQQQKTKKKHH